MSLNNYVIQCGDKNNVWRYTKLNLEAEEKPSPTFNLTKLTFNIPDWIPNLLAPKYEFQTTPPTYAEITSIVRKMKSKGSACPLDQLSIIPFKKSAYLRSYLTEIINEVWKITILIHQKDSTDVL